MVEQIKTADGTTFVGYSNDYLFSLIKGGNTFVDTYVKDAIDKYVTPDSVCVDVGANLGYVSLYLAARCKRVYSFEPQPVVFLQLCANLFLNQRLNVTPYNMGLHSHTTFLDFANYQSGWVGTSDYSDYNNIRSIGSISLTDTPHGTIPANRLDQMINTKVDFIKIDAQGADIDVLIGAQDLVAAYHPIIIFEYEDDLSRVNYGRNMEDVYSFVSKNGYNMTEVYPGNYLLT
jgi:FkbM family methyltransferase